MGRFAAHIRKRFNDPYALANPKYVTDGLTEYAEYADDVLEELYTRQGAFRVVIAPYLRDLIPWPDGHAGSFRPAQLRTGDGEDVVEIDPRYNAGRLSFRRNRVPLFAVLGSLDAVDDSATVMRDYRLTADEVDLVERADKSWLRKIA